MGNLLLESILKKYNVYHCYSAWLQWQQIGQQNQLSMSRLVRNKMNPRIVGSLKVCRDLINLEKSLRISQFRFNFITSPIVGIHGIYSSSQNHNRSTNLCGNSENYVIVTQQMRYCFGDMGQISFNRSIEILRSALIGAKIIMQNLDILPIYDENMIFFDNNNNCKVWINHDLNSNQTSHQTIPIKESDCLNSIFLAVQQKTEHSPQFRDFFISKSLMVISTFEQALKLVDRFHTQQIISFHHPKRPNENQVIALKNNAKQMPSKQKNKYTSKKSLSVKKVKKQTENFVFFSAKKTNISYSENNQNRKNLNQYLNHQLHFKQFQNHKKHVYTLFTEDMSLRYVPPYLQIQTQNQFHEQRKIYDLKKKVKNRNEMKEKFNDSRVKENQKNSKPQSTLSTQYDSTDVSTNFPSRMEPNVAQGLQQINFTKKIVNRVKSPKNRNEFYNYAGNFKDRNSNHQCQISAQNVQHCFSDRKEPGDKRSNTIKSYISQTNTENFQKKKKVLIAAYAPKLSKHWSMPIFEKLDPLLSA